MAASGVSGKLTAVRARSGDEEHAIEARAGSDRGRLGHLERRRRRHPSDPDDFNAELDAHTGTAGPPERCQRHDHGIVTRNSVRGRLGSGGRPVRVRTGDGSITLRRQE
jgi:hypothetical protein